MANPSAALSRFRLVLSRLKKDEKGTALVEYTVLLGMLVVAVIAIIVAVGSWISGEWSALNAEI